MKHSECPSALSGGLLGTFTRGQLYPELDAALFSLEPMQSSSVLESPLGYHLLRCDAIKAGGILPLDEVRPHIQRLLGERRRRECQRAWLERLQTEGPVAQGA